MPNNSVCQELANRAPSITEHELQFYLAHPDHGVRAEFIARRLAQPGNDRKEFAAFVHLVQQGIDHEDA